MAKPRFVTSYHNTDGIKIWRYVPPEEMVLNGIVTRTNLGTDRRRAYAEAARYNKKIDDYRAGIISGTTPKSNSTLKQVVANYYTTTKYKDLNGATQINYENILKHVLSTIVEGKELSEYRMSDIRVRHCALAYEQWCARGITAANNFSRIASVVFNYAIQLEIIYKNPMRYVDKKASSIRQVKWTTDNVKTFLSTAYNDFRYRNIGLIVHMAYEWCQRIGDIRNLKWDAIDFDKQSVTIKQSKRGATVHLPITKGLVSMLKDQYEDFNFQEYVVPNTRPSDGSYRPYDVSYISGLIKEVKDLAGLPANIKAWDLRRTGITELVEAGADSFHIMQVSGHKNVSSVRPYLVNTFKGANIAMTLRFGEDEMLNE
jgi:integrase